MLDATQRRELIALARRSIEIGLDSGQRGAYPGSADPALLEARSSFVTLRVAGELRGCCGTLGGARPLAEDVWNNAWASAFGDPRFAALGTEEWRHTSVHLSILGPLEGLQIRSEAELLATLRPHIDGLCLTWRGSRATFLPSVWQQIPEPSAFLRHLKRKAGWSEEEWPADALVERYVAQSFGEND